MQYILIIVFPLPQLLPDPPTVTMWVLTPFSRDLLKMPGLMLGVETPKTAKSTSRVSRWRALPESQAGRTSCVVRRARNAPSPGEGRQHRPSSQKLRREPS